MILFQEPLDVERYTALGLLSVVVVWGMRQMVERMKEIVHELQEMRRDHATDQEKTRAELRRLSSRVDDLGVSK